MTEHERVMLAMSEERKAKSLASLAEHRLEALRLAHSSGENHQSTIERARAYWAFMIEESGGKISA